MDSGANKTNPPTDPEHARYAGELGAGASYHIPRRLSKRQIEAGKTGAENLKFLKCRFSKA
jgi:hypothetical protein